MKTDSTLIGVLLNELFVDVEGNANFEKMLVDIIFIV